MIPFVSNTTGSSLERWRERNFFQVLSILEFLIPGPSPFHVCCLLCTNCAPNSHPTPRPVSHSQGIKWYLYQVSLTVPFFLCVMPFSAHPSGSQGDLLLLLQLSKNSFPLLSMYPSSDGPYSDPDWLPWFHRSSSLLNSALSPTFLSEVPKMPRLSSLQVSRVGTQNNCLYN